MNIVQTNLLSQIMSKARRAHISGDELVMSCPNASYSSSHASNIDYSPSFSFNLSLQVGFCFTCHWSPNLNMLLRRLGIKDSGSKLFYESTHQETPPQEIVLPSGNTQKAIEWLEREKGITKDWVIRAMITSEEGKIYIPWVGVFGNIEWINIRQSKKPKYLAQKGANKSQTLYGWHLGDVRDEVYLVEGEFDCIHLWSIGVPSLAIGGTNLSKYQIEILKQYSIKNIHVLFDNDMAGIKASKEIKDKLYGYFQVSIEKTHDKISKLITN